MAAESCRRSREKDRASLNQGPHETPIVERICFEVEVAPPLPFAEMVAESQGKSRKRIG
jgi:hypothetical protein